MKLLYSIIRSDKLYLIPTLLEMEQLEIVNEQLEILNDLDLLEVEDSNLLIENEELDGYTSFYNSDDNMVKIIELYKVCDNFFGIVSTIELKNFIIEFGA